MHRFNDFMTRLDLSAMFRYIDENGQIFRYAKGESMVRQGYRCRHIGIVRSGYFKFAAYTADGKEIITGFSFAGNLLTDFVHSFMCDTPSHTAIVAGSDAEVLQVSIASARIFMRRHVPTFESDAAAQFLPVAYRRYLDVHVLSPAERYRKLLSEHPEFVGNLPVQEVASYLGVSRRQLHRIRVAASLESD
ncbi:MAG: Crp/Fnr family transcriptional regulator [Muribaculaceae bacterium]|nr:Crp/Fnr family transcriptional regulator [Muribaculaceae bacterium]